jgi:hypothetical protein
LPVNTEEKYLERYTTPPITTVKRMAFPTVLRKLTLGLLLASPEVPDPFPLEEALSVTNDL